MAYRGNLETTILPTSKSVSFREQNGGDDEILSKMGDAGTGDNVTKFIRDLVKKVDGQEVTLTLAQVDLWPVKDKYALMIKSRIHSLGKELEFQHKCTKCDQETKCEEDLSQYDWDYSKPFPAVDDFEYAAHSKAPRPYDMAVINADGWIYLTTSSKHEIRYKLLDGMGEKSLLEVKQDSLSKLLEMKARGLQWKDETSQYITVQDYRIFSAKDMKEIRTDIMAKDTPFVGLSMLPCKNPKCGQIDMANIISEPAFFFPVVI